MVVTQFVSSWILIRTDSSLRWKLTFLLQHNSLLSSSCSSKQILALITSVLLESLTLQVLQRISTHVEFVKVVSTPRINVGPYYIAVERQPFGTFTGVRNDHPDKFAYANGFTTTTQDIPFDEQSITDVYLSRIGSSLQLNDYIILGRDSTALAPDATTYDVGEVLQIQQPLTQEKIKFRISSDCSGGDSNDVFVVDSTTGDVTIGDNTSTSLLNINGTLNLMVSVIETLHIQVLIQH